MNQLSMKYFMWCVGFKIVNNISIAKKQETPFFTLIYNLLPNHIFTFLAISWDFANVKKCLWDPAKNVPFNCASVQFLSM